MERHPRPGDRDDALDDTDGQSRLFEDRALLDVELEVGAERSGGAGLGAEVADPLELVDETDPVPVPRLVGVLQGDLARQDGRAEHRRLEAGALLVREDRDLDRVASRNTSVVQRPHRLDRADHAERSVEAAAGRHRVDMRPHHDGWAPLAAGRRGSAAEDVAHPVDPHGAAGGLEPRDDAITDHVILVGEGETREAAARRGPDPRLGGERRLQPLPVDARGQSRAPSLRSASSRRLPSSCRSGQVGQTPLMRAWTRR